VGEEDEVLSFLENSIFFQKAFAAFCGLSITGQPEESGQLPEDIALFGMSASCENQQRQGFAGLAIEKSGKGADPIKFRSALKCLWELAFPAKELIDVVNLKQGAAELELCGNVIRSGPESGATEFSGFCELAVLFSEPGICEQKIGIEWIGSGGELQKLFVVDGGGGSCEGNEQIGWLSNLDKTQDVWDSFVTPAGECEELCECGKSGGMIRVELEYLSPGGFGGAEECEALVQQFSSFERGRECATGFRGNGKQDFCGLPGAVECQFGTAGNPE
jgi:hypothetical protein